MSAELSSSLLRAARRRHSDADAIYATGRQGGVPPKQLALLVDRLREAHPKWRLPRGPRDELIDGLLAEGENASEIASRLGCSRGTVAKRVGADTATIRATPIDGSIKRSNCSVSGVCVCAPILSFSASSGALLTPERSREWREALGFD